MLEAKWFASNSPEPMLEFLKGKVSDRKLRLFSCACVRRLGSLLQDRWADLIRRAEAHADGQCSWDDLRMAARELPRPYDAEPGLDWTISHMVHNQILGGSAWAAAWNIVSDVRRVFADAEQPGRAAAESRHQAALLRHIVGNPFRPLPAAPYLGPTVTALTAALLQGDDCAFALHDALLEANRVDLARHFLEVRQHPPGCWAVDQVYHR